VVVEPDLTEAEVVAQEELLPILWRSQLGPTIPWWWELVGRRQSTHLVMAFLEQIHSLVGLQLLAVREGIAVMP
jgi:hypothetical protein